MARQSTYPIQPFILNRWSPRAMSGESLSEEELMTLFEAARWAPSSYNAQPWRFIYAQKDSEHWRTLFSLLGEFNQSWCKNASVLVLIISRKSFEYNGKPNVTHEFDAGAAWENMALQASSQGLIAHGMAGFDYQKAYTGLNIPDAYTVLAMVAVGKPGKKEDLSEDLLKMEVLSDRRPLAEIVFEGAYPQNGEEHTL